jgi:ribosome recycling factor
MSVKNITGESEEKMKKSLDVMGQSLGSLRGGRATPALVENIRVDYYGTMTPMKQVANVTTPDAKTIVIQPWDASAIKAIEKAIAESDLGINPVVDGKIVRLTMPALTRERREEMVKLVKKIAEEGRVALRSIRRDANERIKAAEKDKTATEDESRKYQDDVQKLTDRYVQQIDTIQATKEKELLQA